MGGLTILGIALGLAMDAFAVAIAVGLSIPALTRRHVFRLAWHFALFQAMMPVIGWLAGRTVSSYIAAFDHWVAFGLLSVIGGKMIYEAGHPEQAADRGDPTRGLMLVTLSVATSIDALAVGLSLAFLDLSIWLPSVVIGIVAGILTTVGICFGNRLGKQWEHRAELIGGGVLLLIGLRILLSHFAASSSGTGLP